MLRQAATRTTWPLPLIPGSAMYWATPMRWLLNLFVPNSSLIYKAKVVRVTTMKTAVVFVMCLV